MLISTLAAVSNVPPGENPYGLIPAIVHGGPLAWATAAILVFMSVGTFYILFTKWYDQRKIINQSKRIRTVFWSSPNLKEGAAKLEKDSAYRQVVDDGLIALEQHSKLTDPVEAHDWLHGSLSRSEGAINSKLGEGLAFLATVGSTAPFIGLFGTVVGIVAAFQSIGEAGQASLAVVGPGIAEALVATAVGLLTAIPATIAYNAFGSRIDGVLGMLERFCGQFQEDLDRMLQVQPAYSLAGDKRAEGERAARAE